ncbi:MAG: tetratricopeptide repeat protein [Bacteroidales bacterium]|nr:tetratricopeptide repeat protein [Bacteroidales bacterium]MCF8455152.1 tetratricopeptide repeat protein [Bacteroidales bacterium]
MWFQKSKRNFKNIILKSLLVCFFLPNAFSLVCAQIPDSLQQVINSGDPKQTILAYQQLYEMSFFGDPEQSLKYIQEAIDIAGKNEMSKELVLLYIQAGVANIDRSNFKEAEQYYQLALDKALEIKDSTMLPNIYGNFGNIHMYRGNYEEAISLFIKTYSLFEKAGNERGMLKALGALGNLNMQLPDYEQAISYYKKAYDRFRKIEDIEGAVTTLMNIGICYTNLDQYKKADENYRLAYDESIKSGYKKLAAQCLANRAIVFQYTKRYAEALELSNEAYLIFDDLGDEIEKASCMKDIGVTLFKQGYYTQALGKYLQSYDLIKESGKIGSIEALLEKIVVAYDSLRNYKEAFSYSILLHEIKDSLYNAETHEQILELRNKFELEQKEKEIEIQNLLIEKQNSEMDRYEHERWLFIILLVLFALSAWLFFNRFKLKQKHKEENLMRKNIETEQHLLRSQMNPHFIFNSLNSIQGLISSNDSYLAEMYLSKFAQLVRSILENSKKTSLSLSEDINNLKLYLDLESMRFGDSFEYHLIIDPVINTENVFIPPLLVQPFVENSIKHGLIKMTGKKGAIKIDYFKQGEYLMVVVEDNGIGRDTSLKLKERGSNHKSLGMKVTQERLDSLNKQLKTQASAEIIDLFDDSGGAAGTKVVIKIPYQNL